MTKEQLYLIIATVWIAPHVRKNEGLFFGCVFLIYAALNGLGWL